MQDGKVAMWVDATVAASNLESDTSPVKGKLGYALSPTKVTDASGWLWSWALAIPETAPDKDTAWEFVKWATGPQYLAEAGDVPAALALLDRLELDRYHYLHAARADLLVRLDRTAEAREAYARALELVHSEPERRFLERRLAALG